MFRENLKKLYAKTRFLVEIRGSSKREHQKKKKKVAKKKKKVKKNRPSKLFCLSFFARPFLPTPGPGLGLVVASSPSLSRVTSPMFCFLAGLAA